MKDLSAENEDCLGWDLQHSCCSGADWGWDSSLVTMALLGISDVVVDIVFSWFVECFTVEGGESIENEEK